MKSSPFRSFIIATAFFAGGCATQFPPAPETTASEAQANALLERAISAQGGYLWDKPETVRVKYEGRWRNLVKVLQPVIVDKKFRQRSQETLVFATDQLEQIHQGPSGTKLVVRTPNEVTVHYNSEVSDDAQVRDAAALVADAYTLFLTGPSFFKRRAAQLTVMTPASIDGREYLRLHAILRPGFGFSEEDRAVLWINPESALLELVHFTIEGVASTRGAHVDVAFSDFAKAGDYLWPTSFLERVRGPVAVDAHSWHITELEIKGVDGEAVTFRNTR